MSSYKILSWPNMIMHTVGSTDIQSTTCSARGKQYCWQDGSSRQKINLLCKISKSSYILLFDYGLWALPSNPVSQLLIDIFRFSRTALNTFRMGPQTWPPLSQLWTILTRYSQMQSSPTATLIQQFVMPFFLQRKHWTSTTLWLMKQKFIRLQWVSRSSQWYIFSNQFSTSSSSPATQAQVFLLCGLDLRLDWHSRSNCSSQVWTIIHVCLWLR